MALDSEKYSGAELNEILTQFKVASQEYSFQTLISGYINDTFLVFDANEPLFVLQRINHKVFQNIEGLMMNVNKALQALKADDYAQIKLIPALSGKAYASYKSEYWRVMTYIVNSTTHDVSTSQEIAFEAGKIIGRFHRLLSHEPSAKYVDTIPKFHDLELREMQFLAALARASNQQKAIAHKAICFAEDTLGQLGNLKIDGLPKRICHNDTKLNNILFSKDSKKALCLIDLDTLMTGYFHYDFGDAVRTIANTAAEDEQDHSKITFEKHLFEAFVEGLASNPSFLNAKEIQTLSYGVVLMPFLHGIRALTDYLNGNIYYKVTYENQNLDRCLSLFDFTQKAVSNIDYMNTVISESMTS